MEELVEGWRETVHLAVLDRVQAVYIEKLEPTPAAKIPITRAGARLPAQCSGVGKVLLAELIERARAQEYHVLVGGIDLSNRTSIALHERFGFTHAGTMRQAGFKFGKWLDLAFYQLILETPAHPVDG